MSAASARLMMRRSAPDGFIVVAVLWILAALSALVAIYAAYVIDTAAVFRVHDDGLRVEGLTSAALELTASQLTANPGTRPTRGHFEFHLGHATVGVEFASEASRVDLNSAPKELLAGLLNVLGARSDAAEEYAQQIVRWRTAPSKGQDSPVSTAPAAGLQTAPGKGRFAHVNELSLVHGLPVAVVERVLPFVTVYSGRSQINVVDAEPQVVAALPGMTSERMRAFLAQRQSMPQDARTLIPLLGPAQAYATTESSQASRVKVRIAFDNGRRVDSEVVILIFDDGAEPFAVLSWHDEPDASGLDRSRGRGL